jgi:hypothetical protein
VLLFLKLAVQILGRFIPRKGRRYPPNKRLGDPQSSSGRFGENKSLFHLPNLEPQTVHAVA